MKKHEQIQNQLSRVIGYCIYTHQFNLMKTYPRKIRDHLWLKLNNHLYLQLGQQLLLSCLNQIYESNEIIKK